MAISIVFDKTAEEQIEKVVTPQKRLQEQVVVKSTDEEQIILPEGENVGIKKVIVEPAGGQKLDDGVYAVEGGEVTKVTETGLYGVESSGDYLVLNSLDTDILYTMEEFPEGKEYYSLSSGCIIRINPDTYAPEYLHLSGGSGTFYSYNDNDYTITEANPFEDLEGGKAYEVASSGSELNTLPNGFFHVDSGGYYNQLDIDWDGVYTVTSSGDSFEKLYDGIYRVESGTGATQLWFNEAKAYTGYSSGANYTIMDAGNYTVDNQGYYSSVTYGDEGSILQVTSSGEGVEPIEGGLYYIEESSYGSKGTRYAHSDELPDPMSSDEAIIGYTSGQIYSHVIAPDIGESVTIAIGLSHYTITRND